MKWLDILITELDKAAGLWVTKLKVADEEEGEDDSEGREALQSLSFLLFSARHILVFLSFILKSSLTITLIRGTWTHLKFQ